MYRVFKQSLLTICVFVWGTLAQADEKSHKAAASEVLKAMRMDKQLEAGIDVAFDALKRNQSIPPEMYGRMKKFLTKYMGWEEMEEDLVRIYTKTFNEAELKDMVAFYKSPTGRKVAARTTEISKLQIDLAFKKVQDNQSELIKMISDR